jgi:site-specific recombinase XerD
MSNALQDHLKHNGLLPSTRAKYGEIVRSIPKGQNPIDWLKRKVHARTPIGTVLPMRAAIKHYLISEYGYGEDELKGLLPKAAGRSTDTREALSPGQLAVYHMAADEIDQEPAHTILDLLPMTGLRISEVCGLSRENIESNRDGWDLVFRGKGDKKRIVPLSRSAEMSLSNYIEAHQPDKWLFTGYHGKPIGPHAIRIYTRKMATRHTDLTGLSPHVLRHTFATMALRRGMDLVTLQIILGHNSIQTTRRYLHPDRQMLRDGMRKLEG